MRDLGSRLLAALAERGPRPALVRYETEGRIEMSGRVLADWVIKAVNHLDQEIGLAPQDTLVLELPEHGRRTVLALAGWALGADVHLIDVPHVPATAVSAAAPGPAPSGGTLRADIRVLATTDPASPLASPAEEVLALDAHALSLRFSGQLGPLVRDWVQETRGAGDRLEVPLGPWSGPEPAAELPAGADALGITGDGTGADAPLLLAALCAGRTVVGPLSALDADMRRAEGLQTDPS